ncbi:MAG: ASKHA domain-containing protein, partial [Clostridiales Family XIII bacterium]|nr:ASKHA domain-containing protein [Clostridiales Family XIII bacterium]
MIGVAVDLGTTNIGLSLSKGGKIVKRESFPNIQKIYGADIISRIFSAIKKDKTSIITKQIREEIIRIISSLVDIKELEKLVIVGNPTMISFILDEDLISLSEFPFNPKTNLEKRIKGKEIFGDRLENIDLYFPPVLGGQVGSDILADLVALSSDDSFLLLDIGTNCEIALKKNKEFFICSVPAGNAFLGLNEKYGSDTLEKLSQKFESRKIGKEEEDLLFAKAALITAIKTLLKETRTEIENLKKIVITGIFGNKLSSK